MKLIDGKKIAETIKNKIAKEIFELHGPRPNLGIILVGNRDDSKLYVGLKEKQAKEIGIDTQLYKCRDDITQAELLDIVTFLNNDKTIDAILIQLPLPKQLDTKTIIEAIDPKKDIDGFHSKNLANLTTDEEFKIIPPVYGVILEMLDSIDYNLQDKQVCIVANADIFEDNLANILKQKEAIVSLTKINSADLIEKTKQADVLITAVGEPEYIKHDMIKDQAVIIDIGITKIDGQVVGDVDFNDVKEKVSYITPVPGGVGPMTIAMAFQNTLKVFKRK